MITKIQSTNNTISFRALKPIVLGEKAQKFLSKTSDFSSVHQRIAIGTFAFLIQPLIDLNNKDVDKDTSKVSAVRSASKAVVGTATGIVIRGGCMKLAERKFAKKDAAGNILREAGKAIIDPEKVKKIFGKGFDSLNLDQKALNNAFNRVPLVVGTLAALGIMVATNFLIDAPLTCKLTEKLSNIVKGKQSGGNKNG